MDKLSTYDVEWYNNWYAEIEFKLAPKYKRPDDWQERAMRLETATRNKCRTNKEGLTGRNVIVD